MSIRSRVVIPLVLLALACSDRSALLQPELRPNVLVVMVDALRADRLGVNGYPLALTPNIDRLADEGANLELAFAHSTWTKPSIATLFTSLYPSQHGLTQVAIAGQEGLQSEVLDSHWTTLAERFLAAGYRTGAVLNQVHITSRFGFDQGFEHFRSHRGKAAPRLNAGLLEWLRRIESDSPFFAYLHYLDVHWPYTRRYRALEEGVGSTALATEPPKSGRDSVQEWGQTLELPGDLEALEARYDHEVAFADFQIGELIRSLREMGLYDDTIIVVTADHGEGFLEHGKLLHGHAPYEEMIRIPLVVRLPVQLRGDRQSDPQPVGLIDLMPTLLDLVGQSPEPQAQGRSFAPLLRGEHLRPRLVFVESETALAVRSSARKLLRFEDGRLEHYDLASDPREQRPETGNCGDPCLRLERRLSDFAAAMATARDSRATTTAPLDEADLEEMRSLGYLD